MRTYHVDVPARRTAWLADDAYRCVSPSARTRAAAQGQVMSTRPRLDEPVCRTPTRTPSSPSAMKCACASPLAKRRYRRDGARANPDPDGCHASQ